MAKKLMLARDESNIRKVRKAIRIGVPTVKVVLLDSDRQRERLLLQTPILLSL